MDERQVFVCKLIGKKELFYKGDENYLLIYVYHDFLFVEFFDVW